MSMAKYLGKELLYCPICGNPLVAGKELKRTTLNELNLFLKGGAQFVMPCEKDVKKRIGYKTVQTKTFLKKKKPVISAKRIGLFKMVKQTHFECNFCGQELDPVIVADIKLRTEEPKDMAAMDVSKPFEGAVAFDGEGKTHPAEPATKSDK